MRRLAKQDREDKYASQRDYQTIVEAATSRISFDSGDSILIAEALLERDEPSEISGFGCFIKPERAATVIVTIETATGSLEFSRALNGSWSRLGAAFNTPDDGEVRVTMNFDPQLQFVDVWGFSVAEIDVLSFVDPDQDPIAQLNQDHLVPETLYLEHSEEFEAALIGCSVDQGRGSKIHLKKCSYCARQLPLDPKRPSLLSFHKHNAKVSGHQNECRACKKWRINDSFNPTRTVDQLNESSIITRERKLLLREPEVLQRIKEREGRGLKSIVWEKFGQKCFYCDKPLKLKEVQLDHTRPLAYLWPIDEHATCLCAEHNNHKKDLFPVDFYSEAQIERLSEITGLSVDQLSEKSVCQEQLNNILENLESFAMEVDPRSFNAIARKVGELTDVDLFQRLESVAPDVANAIRSALEDRPEPVI